MANRRSRFASSAGFTLVELLVIIAILAVLIGLILPALQGTHCPPPRKHYVNAIGAALERYRADLGAYPPDNAPTNNGSAVFAHFLCQDLVIGDMHYGPYLENLGSRLRDKSGDGIKELVSPDGNTYEYRLLQGSDGKTRGCLVVDPGPDGQLGGTIDPQKGFVPDKSILNKAGVPACEDNIYSLEPMK